MGMQAAKSKAQQRAAEAEEKHKINDEDVRKVRDAGMAKASVAQGVVDDEKKRQHDRIEAQLAKRQEKMRKKEAALKQKHDEEEARVELEFEKDKLHARPVSKKKAKTLMKELHKVNGIISNLTGD